MNQKTIWTVLLAAVIFAASAHGEVPHLMNYQGKLTDESGAPVSDGDYSIGFSIWSDSTGGDSLWGELQPSVTVENGLFGVLLGSVESITSDLFAGATLWLQMQVSPGPPMTPRQPIVSGGYGFRSLLADTAEYGVTSGYALDVADDAVTSDKIENGSVVDADISATADISADKISGTAWTSDNDGPGTGLDADLLDGLHAADIVLEGRLADRAYGITPTTTVAAPSNLPYATNGDSETSAQLMANANGEDQQYTDIDLGAVYAEGYIRSLAEVTGTSGATLHFKLKVSNDGSSWTTISYFTTTVTSPFPEWNVEFYYIPSHPGGVRYLRYVQWRNGGGVSTLYLHEAIVMASD